MTNEASIWGGGYPCVCPTDIAFSLLIEQETHEATGDYAPIDYLLDLLGLPEGWTMLPVWSVLVDLVACARGLAWDALVAIHVDGLSAVHRAALAEETELEAAEEWRAQILEVS